ncbi:Protein of unknown function DUF2330 [Thalassoporum mexicanum PCC 7367]|uniref:DUF2330 domain-containing protein n=1 Tax=Thalassoporum mexicanum TaxID=3457544 RepID=UPI00029FDF7A|nr:DUF2330 domain-containing protein [Pseudanabaena sp. PCC 7367]AFY71753.1 Protein of unknown function DUF2330 [Pseudanabaena sp. PCC 7367]
MRLLRTCLAAIAVCLIFLTAAPAAWAFCGFYVSKADAKLYNQASQVVLARDGDRTILTMANDYQGEVKDFAIVVPVPTVLEKEQVRIGEQKIIERLDEFSAPRLVEYFDADPCAPVLYEDRLRRSANLPASAPLESSSDQALGVTIESKFLVGEYDILILSAKESSGLETWLRQNNYRIPDGARELLQPYIRQGLKFFVAKVNLEQFQRSDFQFLRPIMIAYESPRFMLPIRLGMANANQAQDLLVYVLSPKGQAELTNYRLVKIPSNSEIPVYIKNKFGDFYKAMFSTAYQREGRKVAFLEYAWDMASCDPCSANPLTPQELRQAGVFWLDDPGSNTMPIMPPMPRGRIRPMPTRRSVFMTRIHVRYSRDRFPADLIFQETGNRQFFQGRYVLRHAFTGEANCDAGREYRRSLPARFEREAQTLASLTGWDINQIRREANVPNLPASDVPFWQRIWR